MKSAPPQDGGDDQRVFRALADPTRRRLLDALRDGPRTTGDLCSAHPEMTRFGVMCHLDVLTDAGLVLVTRAGRTRLNHLNPVPLRLVYERWMRPLAETAAVDLVRLKQAAERS
ncbi:MAG: helix-turn-helix domain-containing protein [Streptosporangiaceae bacterium]|jgi:DNA-binding transcriptional ArsR family regulator